MSRSLFLFANLIWIVWAGKVASDHGAKPGIYRLLGFVCGPFGLLLTVYLVRGEVRMEASRSRSTGVTRALPSWGAPVVVSVLFLGAVGAYAMHEVSARRSAEHAAWQIASDLSGSAAPDHLNAYGIAVDDRGTVFVADGLNQRILKVPKGGRPEVVRDGVTQPQAVAVDHDGTLYIVAGKAGILVLPQGGTGSPRQIAVDWKDGASDVSVDRSGRLLISAGGKVVARNDDGSERVVVTDVDNPGDMQVSPTGDLFVHQHFTNTIVKFHGTTRTSLEAAGATQDSSLLGISMDRRGTLYLLYGDHVATKAPNGEETIVGQLTRAASDDWPTDMAVGPGGEVVVSYIDQIIEFLPAGGSKVIVDMPTTTTPAPCVPGYVPRAAYWGDTVCVLPAVQQRAAADNKAAAERQVSPTDATCKQGWVWREAGPTDRVCVTPDTRTATAQENAEASTHAN